MKFSKVVGLTGFGVAVALALGIVSGHSIGFRLNYTASAPTGLYLLDNETPKRGDMVEVCPPGIPVTHLMTDRGYLSRSWWSGCEETKLTPLLKPLSAVAGDTVVIEAGKPAKVNGTILVNTAPMPAVPAYPAGTYTVQAGEAWTFSSYNAGSIDSRYFGPVSLKNVQGRAQAIAIKGDINKVFSGVKKS